MILPERTSFYEVEKQMLYFVRSFHDKKAVRAQFANKATHLDFYCNFAQQNFQAFEHEALRVQQKK